MPTVTSSDGTRIAYEAVGSGPPLILVDGALCYRQSGPMPDLARALQRDFSVFIYDRRGRGESVESAPYAPEREVEDLQAMIAAAGGEVFVYGYSSGSALALNAADTTPGIRRLMIYEPPFIVDPQRGPVVEAELQRIVELVEAGDRSAAVRRFLKIIEVPWILRVLVRLTPMWGKILRIAHTMPRDFAIVGPYQHGEPYPASRWRGVTMPVLVTVGGKSSAEWLEAEQALARHLPNAEYRVLERQNHLIDARAQAPVIRDFFGRT